VAEIIKPIDPSETASNAQAPQISDKFNLPGQRRHQASDRLDARSTGSRGAEGLARFLPARRRRCPHHPRRDLHADRQPEPDDVLDYGDLTNFELLLFGEGDQYIGIKFNSFTFDSKTGAKTSIQPDIDSVTFLVPSGSSTRSKTC